MTKKAPKFIKTFINKLWDRWERCSYYWDTDAHFMKAVLLNYYQYADINWESEYMENLDFIEDHIEFTYPGLDEQDQLVTIDRDKFHKMAEYFFTENEELVKDEKHSWISEEDWAQMKKDEEEEENEIFKNKENEKWRGPE